MFENRYARIWIKDNILFLEYKPNLILNLKEAKRVVSDRMGLQKNKAFPVLCDPSGILKSNIETLEYLSREGSLLIKALAFLTKNPRSFLLSKFYVETHKQEIPTAVFENKFQALNFLKKKQKKNK